MLKFLCNKCKCVCEQEGKKVDRCCLQEIRWRGQGARFVGSRGRRYKLWLSGINDEIGGGWNFSEGRTLQKDHRSLEKKWQSDGNSAGF